MNWLHTQARFLPECVEPHIVCERGQDLEQWRLPHLHCFTDEPAVYVFLHKVLRKLRLRRELPFLGKMIAEIEPHLVHSHFGNQGWADLVACQRHGVPQITTFYGFDVNQLPQKKPVWRKRYLELFDEVSLVLCEGPHMADCVQRLGCARDKILVHHLGLDLARYRYEARRWDKRTPLRVLISGSFREKKGIPYALRALGMLARDIELEITLIGGAGDDASSIEEERKILQAVDSNNLSNRVRLLGYQPHEIFLDELYRHDVFLSPSVTARDGDTEGGAPVSIIEAAATGIPVVSTTHCDIPNVIKHNETGYLAEERNADALVVCLKSLVADQENWPAMTTGARAHIETNFDAVRQGEKLAEIYRTVIDGRSSKPVDTPHHPFLSTTKLSSLNQRPP